MNLRPLCLVALLLLAYSFGILVGWIVAMRTLSDPDLLRALAQVRQSQPSVE